MPLGRLSAFDSMNRNVFFGQGMPGLKQMLKHNNGMKQIIKTAVSSLTASALLLALGVSVSNARAAETKTVKGEVVDLMCYLDHGAKGEQHAGCAEKCIKSGGPVGILTPDNQVYLVIGDHEPMNKELAPFAAKTITVKGKVVERDGMKMIENAEIVKD